MFTIVQRFCMTDIWKKENLSIYLILQPLCAKMTCRSMVHSLLWNLRSIEQVMQYAKAFWINSHIGRVLSINQMQGRNTLQQHYLPSFQMDWALGGWRLHGLSLWVGLKEVLGLVVWPGFWASPVLREPDQGQIRPMRSRVSDQIDGSSF